jgi:hypothetical protein
LGGDEIRQFETYLLRDKKLAPGTVEGRMSALRFLYKKTLKRVRTLRGSIVSTANRDRNNSQTGRKRQVLRNGWFPRNSLI